MIFLRKSDMLRMHQRSRADFGGADGLRDPGALESALVAAENRHHYEEADVIACAAAYAFHLSKAHAFIDGNKRVAAAATEVFLVINGYVLDAEDDELYTFYIGVADGSSSRDDAEAWLRARARML